MHCLLILKGLSSIAVRLHLIHLVFLELLVAFQNFLFMDQLCFISLDSKNCQYSLFIFPPS